MLYFDEYGSRDNPTILMLHGAAALDTFCHQYCFSNKYHLVVPHLYGAGRAADKIYNPEMIKNELFDLIANLHKDKIGIIGHSLGGQIAIMLVCERPELFSFAVFLSAWINPKPDTVKMYCRFAGLSAKILHLKCLVKLQGQYWNLKEEQVNYMAEYSQLITPQVYKSFFENTLDLSQITSYQSVCVPMLAVCGNKEVKDMKLSLNLLAQNSNCQTIILEKSKHDFPMRNSEKLNPILEKFFSNHTEINKSRSATAYIQK